MNIFDTFITQPIFNFLLVIYSVIGDFGVAIIILTILIRLALWPLVKKQLHQTKLMRSIQPELKKIKTRAKGNRMLESTLMMELYREKGIKPFSSLLVLLIQLPIFIALFSVIRVLSMQRDQIEHFVYGFLHGLPRIGEIIADPNAFNGHLFGVIDLVRQAVSDVGIYWPAMILAILAAVFQYIQSKQTLPSAPEKRKLRDIFRDAAAGKKADQTEMNGAMMGGMVKIFPILTFVIAINFSGALVLYYAVTSIVAVIQQHFVLKKDLGELENLAAKKTTKNSSAGFGKTASKSPREKRAVEAEIITRKPTKNKNPSTDKSPKPSGGQTVVRRLKAK